MNSEYEKTYQDAKDTAKKKLELASRTTPCYMVTEENWNAMLAAMAKQLEMMGKIVTSEQMVSYINQLNQIFTKEAEWLNQERHSIATDLANREHSISAEMEMKARDMTQRLESQAGKMSEQNASDLEKAKKELQEQMQDYSDRMYHRILLPCLILTLLASVLVLLQML